MLHPIHSKKENILVSALETLLKSTEEEFKNKSIESHIFGSVARNDADPYSDLDVWFTFEDQVFPEVFENRFKYYNNIGKIIHTCEAPQNAPIGGVHTALIIKTETNYLTMVDIYLCPLSTAYITNDGKKLFGIDLPQGTIGFNPQKIQIDENYRIDFFICFIFNTIKKIIRKSENPLDGVIREYNNLQNNYGIPVKTLNSEVHGIKTLEDIIKNVQMVSNEKQKITLDLILDFTMDLISEVN